MYLEVMDGNLICSKCKAQSQGYFPQREEEEGHRSVLCILTPGALAAWRYCTECPLEKFLSFRLETEEEQRLFMRSAEQFLLNHLDHGFISLDFYRQVSTNESF